jgi:hypothetical protein
MCAVSKSLDSDCCILGVNMLNPWDQLKLSRKCIMLLTSVCTSMARSGQLVTGTVNHGEDADKLMLLKKTAVYLQCGVPL